MDIGIRDALIFAGAMGAYGVIGTAITNYKAKKREHRAWKKRTDKRFEEIKANNRARRLAMRLEENRID